MIGGALKLGVAAGVSYTMGGHLGTSVLGMIKKDPANPPSADAVTGAAWAGRIASFVILSYLLSRV